MMRVLRVWRLSAACSAPVPLIAPVMFDATISLTLRRYSSTALLLLVIVSASLRSHTICHNTPLALYLSADTAAPTPCSARVLNGAFSQGLARSESVALFPAQSSTSTSTSSSLDAASPSTTLGVAVAHQGLPSFLDSNVVCGAPDAYSGTLLEGWTLPLQWMTV